MENKQVIGIVQVLQHLKDGMTRDDIAAHYSISKAECKLLFQHEDLKGKKTIKKPSFVIVDDATAEIEVKAEEVVEVKKEAITEVVVEEVVEEETVEETVEAKEDFGAQTTDEVEEVEEVIETESAKATWE